MGATTTGYTTDPGSIYDPNSATFDPNAEPPAENQFTVPGGFFDNVLGGPAQGLFGMNTGVNQGIGNALGLDTGSAGGGKSAGGDEFARAIFNPANALPAGSALPQDSDMLFAGGSPQAMAAMGRAPAAAPAPTSPGQARQAGPALGRMMAQGQMQRTGVNPLQGAAPMNISASQIGPGGINNRATYGAQPANPNFQGGLRPAPSNYRPPRGGQPMLSPNTVGRSGYQPANTGMPVNAMPGRTASGQPTSMAMKQFNAQPQQRATSQPMIGTFGGPLMAQGRFFNR